MASLKKRHKKTPLCDSGIFYGASMALRGGVVYVERTRDTASNQPW
jgi:hypothetical protein|tara:strand:- start:16 stop:153 length:138 start_codon:yes stop_codon:yes gene_type:complete